MSSQEQSQYIPISNENTDENYFLKKRPRVSFNVDVINARFKNNITIQQMNIIKTVVKPFDDAIPLVVKLILEGQNFHEIAQKTGLSQYRVQNLFIRILKVCMLHFQRHALRKKLQIIQREIQHFQLTIVDIYKKGIQKSKEIVYLKTETPYLFQILTQLINHSKQDSIQHMKCTDLIGLLFTQNMFQADEGQRQHHEKDVKKYTIIPQHLICDKYLQLNKNNMTQKKPRLNDISQDESGKSHYYFTAKIQNQSFRTILTRTVKALGNHMVQINKECLKQNMKSGQLVSKLKVLQKKGRLSNNQFSNFINDTIRMQQIILAKYMIQAVKECYLQNGQKTPEPGQNQTKFYVQHALSFKKLLQEFVKDHEKREKTDKIFPGKVLQRRKDIKIQQKLLTKKEDTRHTTLFDFQLLTGNEFGRWIAKGLMERCLNIDNTSVFIGSCLRYDINQDSLKFKINQIIGKTNSRLLSSDLLKDEKKVIVENLFDYLLGQGIKTKCKRTYPSKQAQLNEIVSQLAGNLNQYQKRQLGQLPIWLLQLINPEETQESRRKIKQKVDKNIQNYSKKTTRFHTLIHKEQQNMMKEQRQLGECKEHSRTLQGYCKHCDCFICPGCFMSKNSLHHGHQVEEARERVEYLRGRISKAAEGGLKRPQEIQTQHQSCPQGQEMSVPQSSLVFQQFKNHQIGKLIIEEIIKLFSNIEACPMLYDSCRSHNVDQKTLNNKCRKIVKQCAAQEKIKSLFGAHFTKEERKVIVQQLLVGISCQIKIQLTNTRRINGQDKRRQYEKISSSMVKSLREHHLRQFGDVRMKILALIDPTQADQKRTQVLQRVNNNKRNFRLNSRGSTVEHNIKKQEKPLDFGNCLQHSYRLQGYCAQYNYLICFDCYKSEDSSHRYHKVVSIDEGIKQVRRRLNKAANDGLMKYSKNQQPLSEISHAKNGLRENADDVLRCTENYFDQLIQELRLRKTQIVDQMRGHFNEHKKAIKHDEEQWLKKQNAYQSIINLRNFTDLDLMQEACNIMIYIAILNRPVEHKEIRLHQSLESKLKIRQDSQKIKEIADGLSRYHLKRQQITNQTKQL